MAEQLLSDRVRVLGPDHPSTLATRGHLARARSEAGDDHAAVAELVSLLDDRIRVLGADDPAVLTTRHNLAAVLSPSTTGDLHDGGSADKGRDRVEQLIRENLTEHIRLRGSDDPDVLVAVGLLAEHVQRRGDHDGAIELLEGLVERRIGMLGAAAVPTLTSRRMLVETPM